jgi:hypothetical protein
LAIGCKLATISKTAVSISNMGYHQIHQLILGHHRCCFLATAYIRWKLITNDRIAKLELTTDAIGSPMAGLKLGKIISVSHPKVLLPNIPGLLIL